MAGHNSIAIVGQDPVFVATLVSWVESAGYDVISSSTFKAARAALDSKPALLITELKLGEYNGLHLALRAKGAGIPSVVVGPSDRVLMQDAVQLGVLYLTSTIRKQILKLVSEYLAIPHRHFERRGRPDPEPLAAAHAAPRLVLQRA